MMKTGLFGTHMPMRIAARRLWRAIVIGSVPVVLLAHAHAAAAAVAFDSAASSSATASSLTWGHTVSGSNRVLLVGVSIRSGTVTVSNVTYNATALTRIAAVTSSSAVRAELWGLVAPSTGTANVVVTLSASANVVGGSASFTGAVQGLPTSTTTPSPQNATATGSSTTASVSIGTNSGEFIVDTLAAQGDASTATAGGSQTPLWNTATGTLSTDIRGAGSRQAATSTTATMQWTLGASVPWALVAARLAPFYTLTLSPETTPTFPTADTDTSLPNHGLTWDMIGLDSNKPDPPDNDGPTTFMVGARILNSGPAAANDVTAQLVFDGCPGSGSTFTCSTTCVDFAANSQQSFDLGTISVGSTKDVYFNVTIPRQKSCWSTYRPYHILVTGDGGFSTTTPAGRQLAVQKLISQDRNAILSISGPLNVFVGSQYTYTLDTQTAPGGYSSHETFINLPNQVFGLVSMTGCYKAPGGSGCNGGSFTNGFLTDQIWANACNWMEDPTHPAYSYTNSSCTDAQPYFYPDLISGGKAGDNVRHLFTVSIIAQITGLPTMVALTPLIYDFSGSSYHYNSDFNPAPVCVFGSPGSISGGLCIEVFPPPTSVGMRSSKATRRGNGMVDLEWQTEREERNLGFRVAREQGRGRVPVSPIIAGSAILAGADTPLKAGNAYRFTDTAAGVHYSGRYWIESLDVDGRSLWHGPIEVRRDEAAPRAASPLLQDLNALVETETAYHQGVRVLGPALAQDGADAKLDASGARLARIDPLAASSSGAQNQQTVIAGLPAAKVSVKKNGWYSVPQTALAAVGFNVGADPRKLQLFADGIEQPISVIGESDGHFDASDSVGFSGTGLDIPTTDTHVYYLINGSKGQRIAKSAFASAPPISSHSFLTTVEAKPKIFFFPSLQNGDADSFFGPIVYSAASPTVQHLPATHVDTAPPGDSLLTVSIQGAYDDTQTNPDHHVLVAVNGAYVGEMFFDGLEQKTSQFSVASSLVQEGDNTVTLTAVGGLDFSFLNYIDLSYWHTFTADAGSLAFSAPSQVQVKVGGFTSGSVRVFDVTNPSTPAELGTSVSANGALFDATVKVPGTGTRSLLSVQSDAASSAGLRLNKPSSLHAKSTAADLVVIAHGSLLPNAAALVTQRQIDGYQVVAADIEDVYDEFSFGAHDPAAVKSFLGYAVSSWKTPPRFALLLGDASFDPRNYLGFGDTDLVPTKLLLTKFLKTASDDWLADFNGDGVADMAIGRMPARNPSEADIMVGKAVAYAGVAAGDWNAKALLVSDADDGQGDDFPTASAAVATLLPAGVNTHPITVGQSTPDARTDLLQQLDDGALLLNFLGHGSVELWTTSGLFTKSDAYALTNGDRLPVVVALTCLTGFFHDLYTESMAEALLRAPNGGAVAVWGSSGLTFLQGQQPADQELVRRLFGATPTTLGEAVIQAKLATSDADVRRTWILFGDPTTKLRKP